MTLNVAKIDTLDVLCNRLCIPLARAEEHHFNYGHDYHPEVNFENDEHCEDCDYEYRRIQYAAEATANKVLGWGNLEWEDNTLRPVKGKTWDDAARAVVDVINGVGIFEFRNVEHLVAGGPYASVEDAVRAHIHWLAEYPDVYGDRSVREVFDRALMY